MKKYKNIINYIQSTPQTFEEKEFCVVDSLILSQVAYFKMDEIVPGLSFFTKGIKIKDLFLREYFHRMFHQVRDRNWNERLITALASSPRFRDITLKFYVDDVSIQKEQQFSAVVFLITKQVAYVAFRGTDATAVGWKEDFNMAFMKTIPAQREALRYLNVVAKWTRRRLILGGHSKGGNLAVYAGSMCHPRIQSRINAIYNHDGPGFSKGFFASSKYQRIEDRIHKTVPESSLIGMLLESQGRYYVVKSVESGGIMQHNPYSWIVENGDFIYTQHVSDKSKHMDIVLYQWIQNMSISERKRFATILYELLSANEGLAMVSKFSMKDLIALGMTVKDMDTDTRNHLVDTIKKLVTLYVKMK
ncbi:MAG: Mbeg1-like protein [Anaerostipes sp.]|jgi:hypothetical protein|nr:DUF2974 domain-containing protein [Anaerostipes sp.]